MSDKDYLIIERNLGRIEGAASGLPEPELSMVINAINIIGRIMEVSYENE